MSEIEEWAIHYVNAREKRNAAKAHRSSFECEVQDEAEHDGVGFVNRGWAPCYVRDDGDRCSTCVGRDAAHDLYLAAAREMGAAWSCLRRRVGAK